MSELLYVLTGLATGLILAHRHAVADAIWRAMDWLCEDPEPARPAVGARNVRVVREGER